MTILNEQEQRALNQFLIQNYEEWQKLAPAYLSEEETDALEMKLDPDAHSLSTR